MTHPKPKKVTTFQNHSSKWHQRKGVAPKDQCFNRDGQRHIVCCHSIWSIFPYKLMWSQLVGSFKQFLNFDLRMPLFPRFLGGKNSTQPKPPPKTPIYTFFTEDVSSIFNEWTNQMPAIDVKIQIIHRICVVKIFHFFASFNKRPEKLLKFQNPYRT